jgi:uncharacterized membrane protein
MNKRHLWIAVILLLIGFGLRLWNLDTQSLWFDEGFSWHVASQPTLAQTWIIDRHTTNPPLHHALLHIWIRLAGDSVFSMRALSLFEGTILLAAIAALARCWFGKRAGLPALIVGTFMPIMWWASQEIRMYNTLALTVLLTIAGMVAIHRDPPARQRRAWIMLVLGEIAVLYTHNSAITIVGAVNIVAGLAYLIGLIRRQPVWRQIGQWALSQIIVVILWLPEILQGLGNVSAANAASAANPPAPTPELLWQTWQGLWASSWKMVLAEDSTLIIMSLLALTLLVISLTSLKQRPARLALGFMVAWLGLLIAALIAIGVNYHSRYLLTIAPIFAVLVGGGIESLLHARQRWYPLTGGLLTVLVGAIWLLGPGNPNPAYQHDQADQMAQYYAETLGTGDLVVSWSYASRHDLRYYWQHMDITAQLVILPDGSDATTALAQINEHLAAGSHRIAVDTWYTQPSDRRGMLHCLLGHDHRPPAPAYTVYGMSATTYDVTGPLTLPDNTVDLAVDFGPLDIAQLALPAESLPADRGVCLPIRVTIQNTVADDFQLAARLLNPLGAEIASSDVPIMNVWQQATGELPAGVTVTAYPLLHFPTGTPPGDYPLQIRLYSATNVTGLDVLDSISGAPIGKDADAGHISVIPGEWTAFVATSCDLSISPAVTLTNCADLPREPTINAGQMLPLTLQWHITGDAPTITIALQNDSDTIATDTAALTTTGPVLDWRALLIPADASGPVRLTAQVDDSPVVELGAYALTAPEHLMLAPEVAQQIGIEFPEMGALFGYTIEPPANDTIPAGAPLTVTLVWQAEAAASTAYAITAQLLSEEGQLLAQHDSQPVNGQRPTTGWLAEEYLVDSHTLEFLEGMETYTGRASLIVAVYDPADFTRLPTDTGDTHALLTDTLTISVDSGIR